MTGETITVFTVVRCEHDRDAGASCAARARAVVMAAERRLGFEPTDRENQRRQLVDRTEAPR